MFPIVKLLWDKEMGVAHVQNSDCGVVEFVSSDGTVWENRPW